MIKIENIINSNEKVIAVRHPHWIYMVEGVSWFLLIAGIGIYADMLLFRYAGSVIAPGTSWFDFDWGIIHISSSQTPISLISVLTGAMVMIPFLLIYISGLVILTDRRLIRKAGLFFVQIDQLDLEDIRGEHINHGYLGWLLGYASIRFDSRFIEDLRMPAFAKPHVFVKATHNMRRKNPKISYEEADFEKDVHRLDEDYNRATSAARLRVLKQRMNSSFRKVAKKPVKK